MKHKTLSTAPRLVEVAGEMDAVGITGGETGSSRTEVLLASQQRILEMIAKSEPFEVVLSALASFIEAQSPGTLCSILGISADGNTFCKGAAPSLSDTFQDAIDGQPIDANDRSCGAAVHRREMVVSKDIGTDPLWDTYRDWICDEYGIRSAWSSPIFSPCGSSVVGVFTLYSKAPGTPSEADRELIGICTHLAEIAFERKRMMEDLHQAKCEAEEASFAKSKFLANISHELRTPLNAIIGYSEILMEELEDLGQGNLANDMENVRMAGQRLLAMIGSILDISKIEADMMKVNPISFSLSSIVDNVVASAAAYIEGKGNRLVVDSGATTDTMFADPDKLIQILQHLVSNANKFTDNGTVTLSLSQEVVDQTECVIFKVSDTGIGLTPEQTEKVFTAFAHVDDSLVKKHGGIGLGLALSYNYAKMMGGDIHVESEVGKGATFIVRLPIVMNAPD